jgi:hypothetical protein
MSEPNLNAAQQAQVQRALEEQLFKYVRQIELRKWAIEKAISTNEYHEFLDVIKLAQGIYDFVRSE